VYKSKVKILNCSFEANVNPDAFGNVATNNKTFSVQEQM
jgi:hypothetical protein